MSFSHIQGLREDFTDSALHFSSAPVTSNFDGNDALLQFCKGLHCLFQLIRTNFEYDVGSYSKRVLLGLIDRKDITCSSDSE